MAVARAALLMCVSLASGEVFDGFIRRRPDEAISQETGKLTEASRRMTARAMQQNQDNLKSVAQLQDKSAREIKLDRLIEDGVIHAKTRANQRREMQYLEEQNKTRLAQAEKEGGKESLEDAQKRMSAMDIQLTEEAEFLVQRQKTLSEALVKVRRQRQAAEAKASKIKSSEAKATSEFQKKLDLVRQKQAEHAERAKTDFDLLTKEKEKVAMRLQAMDGELKAARKKAQEAVEAEKAVREEEAAKDLAAWEKERAAVTKTEAELGAQADLDAKKQAKMKAAFKQWASTRVSETKAEKMSDHLSKLKGAERLAEDVERENVETLKRIQAEKARREAEKLRKAKEAAVNEAERALDNRTVIAAKLDGDAAAQAKAEVAAREHAAAQAEEAELADPESAAAAEAEAQKEAEAYLKERKALKEAIAMEHGFDK